MRCSSFEPHLPAFIDGDLGPVMRARVAQHLGECDACSTFAHELRSIDALLLGARDLEPAANFSFKVMADVRALPLPHRSPSRPFAILATYVVFAWGAIGAFLAFGGGSARAMLAMLGGVFGHFTATTGILAAATGRLFGNHLFDVTAAMGALLAIDLVVAAAFVGIYALSRGRSRAAVARSESC